jgi:hypothetical protein
MWLGEQRHEFDPVSLVLGLVLISVATTVLVVGDFHVRWVLPGMLIALGVVGLAGSLTRRGRRVDELPQPEANDATQSR